MEQQFSLASIWSHGDLVTHAVAVILMVMQIAAWTVIVLGVFRQIKFNRHRKAASGFWGKPSLEDAVSHIPDGTCPWKMLVMQGQYSAQGFEAHTIGNHDLNAKADWITRGLMTVLDKVSFYQRYGLTLLSSIGATAPFVGLFGTVWGIYHTLIALSGGGQMSIERVAGPIGEALVMTAFGLVVAIPAVLGNNAIAGNNRKCLEELGMFAQELQMFLVTGQRPLGVKNKP